jgi:hypothetical protein
MPHKSEVHIIRAIKLRTMGLVRHVARMGEMRSVQKSLVKTHGKGHLEVQDVDERMILKWRS